MNEPVLALGLGGAASVAAMALLRRLASRLPHDTPNPRSLHDAAVPRAGGLAILAGIAVASLVSPPGVPGSAGLWLAAVAAVAAVSFRDDLRGVPAAVRLAVQFAAAAVVSAQLVDPGVSPWPAAAFAFAIVWGANLFNFMDGSDGLAATMSVVGFAAYAVAALHAGGGWVPHAAIAVAVLPFLAANLPRASMFMGDVGAVPLGFLAAALGIAGIVQGTWPSWFPALVFLPFVADATLTLALRMLRGEKVWQAHRSHFYQQFNTLGAGHRGTLSLYAGLMMACAALALVCLVLAPGRGESALAVALAVHVTGFALIHYHWRKGQAARSK